MAMFGGRAERAVVVVAEQDEGSPPLLSVLLCLFLLLTLSFLAFIPGIWIDDDVGGGGSGQPAVQTLWLLSSHE